MLPNDYAKLVHKQCWDNALPLNPVSIAGKLGVTVYSSPNLGSLGGYYDAENKRIVINANNSVVRQRFTIAHELGHHVLGHGSSPRDNTQMYNKESFIPKEFEANAFAAELLMPEDAVRVMVEQRRLPFSSLLDTFGVSADAMRIRLERMGYI